MAELPRFTAGSDPGSSFFQLLTASEAQRGLGNPGDIISCETGWSAPTPDATTIVAIRSADGVVIAGDRRATMGHAIDTRDIRKVFRTDRFSAVGIAGAAGPAATARHERPLAPGGGRRPRAPRPVAALAPPTPLAPRPPPRREGGYPAPFRRLLHSL